MDSQTHRARVKELIKQLPKHPGMLRRYSGTKQSHSKSDVNNQYIYTVTLYWQNHPDLNHWNNVCGWAVERYGLPGKRYTTVATGDFMTWAFVDKNDLLMFVLAWGDDVQYRKEKV